MDRAHSAATVVSYHARDFLELRLGEKLARSVEAACIDRKLERWPDRTSLRPWSRTTLEISSSFGSGKSSHVPSMTLTSIGSSSDGPSRLRGDRGLVPRSGFPLASAGGKARTF